LQNKYDEFLSLKLLATLARPNQLPAGAVRMLCFKKQYTVELDTNIQANKMILLSPQTSCSMIVSMHRSTISAAVTASKDTQNSIQIQKIHFSFHHNVGLVVSTKSLTLMNADDG
jgi:hypothetical protein